jgi:hypothetical protein
MNQFKSRINQKLGLLGWHLDTTTSWLISYGPVIQMFKFQSVCVRRGRWAWRRGERKVTCNGREKPLQCGIPWNVGELIGSDAVFPFHFIILNEFSSHSLITHHSSLITPFLLIQSLTSPHSPHLISLTIAIFQLLQIVHWRHATPVETGQQTKERTVRTWEKKHE